MAANEGDQYNGCNRVSDDGNVTRLREHEQRGVVGCAGVRTRDYGDSVSSATIALLESSKATVEAVAMIPEQPNALEQAAKDLTQPQDPSIFGQDTIYTSGTRLSRESIGKATHQQVFGLHDRWCNDGHDKSPGISVWDIRLEEETEEKDCGNVE